MLYTKTYLLTRFKVNIFWNKDFIYNSLWFTKFMNQLVWQGKKEKIEKYFFNTLRHLRAVTLTPNIYFFEILFMLKPLIILRWIRLGRKWHQVARPIFEELQYRCVFLLLSKTFRMNEGVNKFGSPEKKLYEEIINLVHFKNSKLLDYKKDTYSIAIYNRSLFRFKW